MVIWQFLLTSFYITRRFVNGAIERLLEEEFFVLGSESINLKRIAVRQHQISLCKAYARYEESSGVTRPAGQNLVFRKLNADLNLFQQTWSKQARHNLMNDALREIRKFRQVVPDADVQRECLAFEAKLGDLLKIGPKKQLYDTALLFGWKVKCADDKFTGVDSDWEDMKQKCTDMISAIKTAMTLSQRHHDDNGMLKIFMAPEFYFRGKNGAYDHDLFSGMETEKNKKSIRRDGILDLMRAEIDRPEYKNWLFVLGSAILATRISEVRCATPTCGSRVRYEVDKFNRTKTRPKCIANPSHFFTKETTKAAQIDNLAIVMKGKKTHTIAKDLVSHIDFVTDKAAGITDQVNVRAEKLSVKKVGLPSGMSASDPIASGFKDERMGGCIFTIDGITVGLEVCLDHGASSSSATKGRLDNAANIQILLIPSAGMTINSFPTVKGGIIFNVDGLTPHVQVIGVQKDSGARTEARFDREGGGANFNNRYLGSVDYTNPSAVNMSKGIWDQPQSWTLDAGPLSGAANKGAVLRYGPYEIPTV